MFGKISEKFWLIFNMADEYGEWYDAHEKERCAAVEQRVRNSFDRVMVKISGNVEAMRFIERLLDNWQNIQGAFKTFRLL